MACASCADDGVVRVKVAEGFTPGQTTISVLGVYKDGRMSVDAWSPLSVQISAALGAPQVCEPAFGSRLQREDEVLFSSIDDEAKNDGITEALLAKLAPSAQGDVILAITVHGGVGLTTDKTDKASPPPRTPPPGGGGMGRGLAGQRGAGSQREATNLGPRPKLFELTASLFSSKQRVPLARLTLDYTGSSADDAVRQFSQELGKLVPHSVCKGWSFAPKPKLPESVGPILEGP